jgi:hypothetical protein
VNLIWALGLRSNGSDRTVPFRRVEIVKEPLHFSRINPQLGLKTIGNGRENAQTITVTVFFAEIGNGNGNVGRTNETDITRYRERNIFNREQVDYDRESVTQKIAYQVPNRPTCHNYYL